MKAIKLLVAYLLIIAITPLNAQPGTLDNSFGFEGKILDSSIWATCRVVKTQPDGKILTGGYTDTISQQNLGGLFIGRYNSDGSIDENFGINGKVIIRKIEGALPIYVQAIEILKDNKILACGRFVTKPPYGGVGLLRLFPDGKIDSAFGVNGFVTTRLSKWNDIIGGMVVQADGKILVTGNKQSSFSQPGADFMLRYMPDGNLDQNFGVNGVIYTTYNSNVTPGAVILQSDGKIITGDIYGASILQLQLTRYNIDGTLDESFGNSGIARLLPVTGNFSSLNDLTIQDDGKIIAAGQYGIGSMLVARFQIDGQPDLNFGNLKGYAYLYTPGTIAEAKNVFITKTNKIILTGSYFNEKDKIAVVRFNENGLIDSLFGENGIAPGNINNLMGADVTSGEGALQNDGKILVSGSFLQNDDDTYNVGLFRYNGDDPERNKYVRIKHWLHHHGISWEDKPNNLINYYSIQSSTNGNAFTEVERIYSNHNGGIQTYSAANNATANYRVAAVSNTGNITYSNTLTLVNNTPNIQLYPNPAKNNLQIQGLPAGTTKLTVTDISGNTRIIATANSTVYSINIAQLTSGNYLLHIKTANEVITKQFIKE